MEALDDVARAIGGQEEPRQQQAKSRPCAVRLDHGGTCRRGELVDDYCELGVEKKAPTLEIIAR
jgi:hypothetical protein